MIRNSKWPRLVVSASLALAAAFACAAGPYWFGFEGPTFSAPDGNTDPGPGWHTYPSNVTRATPLALGIPTRSGQFLGVIAGGPGSTGAFTRFGGYSPVFGGGYTTSQDVYLDVNDPSTTGDVYGFDLSCANSTNAGNFNRDFIFHAAGYANHTILIAASNNSNFARRNDLASLNHYTVTKSGWYTFQWVFRNLAGNVAVDCNLLDANGQRVWTETRYTTDPVSTIGGNRYAWFTFLTPSQLVVDNTQIELNSAHGVPVDLNGTYRSTSSGTPGSGQSGLAGAFTTTLAALGTAQTLEINASLPATSGTFTPFNDFAKKPHLLDFASVNNTSFEADVEVSGDWVPFQWSPATGDTFALGFMNNVMTFGVRLTKNSLGQIVANLAGRNHQFGGLQVLEPGATLADGTTRVRINAVVSSGVMTATVTALDGPDAFNPHSVGSSNGSNMVGNVNHGGPITFSFANAGYTAGFETHENQASAANAKVTHFTTSAGTNALYQFVEDPYIRSLDGPGSILYSVGQANLLQGVRGFQTFMNASGMQSFNSGLYSGPFTVFNPSTISSALAAAATVTPAISNNIEVARIFFDPSSTEGAASMGFNPNVGSSANIFADLDFADILANVLSSNTVLIDNTAPSLGTPQLIGSQYNGNVVQGNLKITVNAVDFSSGLDGRPEGVITWSDNSKTTLPTYSLSANDFQSAIAITSSTPNGPASVTYTVTDRAGNENTITKNFNVSTINLTVTLNEVGVTQNVNRWVKITVGGSGTGSHAPILVDKLVNFSTPVSVGTTPSRQGTVVITYQDLDAADGGGTNSVNGGAAITALIAKDPFFSLAKSGTFTGSAGSLNTTLDLQMGDVTDNNVVNVSDLAVWTAYNGTAQSGSTIIGQSPTPRQSNIDGTGIVDTADRNLILSAWLAVGDGSGPGNFNRGGQNDGSQTVAEVVKETGFSLKLVMTIDTNKDGIITRQEVLAWRPNSK